MDTSLSSKTGRLEQSEVEDLKSEFTSECSFLPDNQHSCMGDKQHLQVYLRIRPFTPEESKKGESQDCVTMEGPDTVLLRPPSSSVTTRFSMDRAIPQAGQRFRFSKVYGPETTQRELFNGTVKDLVKDTLEGRSALVFTYGVTNAGKTFTFLGPDADAGILPRSLDIIFNSMEGHVFSGMSIKPHRCQELSRLNEAQQAEEALFKRNLFRQSVEIEKSKSILSSLSSETFLAGSFPAKSSAAAEDRVNLKVELTTKFSVWVSFCEIYNENIHDLLEVTPGGAQKRMALRLSQDINGNAFIKDLRWVQVETAEEAYKVVKLGKKNQSFCSTRLNNLSSRSHSIFSIRILRIEDVNVPLVSTVSELCLCDLAGSERCAKTQNKGERLKEAGNINTSLLILGKCINALRNNQHTKLLQHVPFRESKLTHYLQGFFCGRGKTCMIVNINQCASMYDETLGVLKFSAVAQKVAVLFSKPFVIMPLTSTSEVPLNQSTVKKAIYSSDRSSLIGWESSLDDVQEDENLDEDVSFMEDTLDNFVDKDDEKVVISKGKLQRLIAELKQLQVQLKKERAESMLLEGRIREETSQEFSQLFHEMQKDFTERLAREKEILEDRAEKRMQICRNLINKMYNSGSSQDAQDMDTSAELADRDFAEVSYFRQSLSQAGPQTCRTDTGIKLESSDQQKTQNQLADDPDAIEERRIVLQLQEKSAEVARLTEQLEELQKLLAQASTTPSVELEQRSPQKKNQLEEAFAALEKAKTEKEEAIAALEYQTLGKEEALTFLEEERKAREEAIASLEQLRRLNEEMQELLEQEKRGKEKAAAALEIEKRANEDFVSALSKEKQSREEAHAALCEERRRTQEVQSALESERTKSWELAEERGRMQQEVDALQRELRQLTEKLEAAEQQVANKTEVAEQALAQVGAVQTQLETESSEVQEKTCQLETLTQKLQTLEEELLTNHISSEGDREKLKEELLELQSKLAQQKDQREKAQSHVQELEHELTQVKKQLAQNQLVSEQISDKLSQAEASSKEKQEGMLHKLTDELRAQFECQLREAKEEVDQLRANLQEQTNGSDKQIRQLNEQLQKQDLLLKQQHEDWTQKLSQENETSSKHLNDLKEKLSQKEQALNLLEAELASKLSSNLKTEEDLRRLNSDLQSEVASLKATLSNMKAKEFSVDIDQMLKVKDEQMKEKLAELKRASEDREAELKKKVLEAEAQVASLQKTLLAAQEKREEDECQAVREARRKEVERRKELLAVAHEAIAQKDAELEKKTEEISRLKEIAKQDAEKMKTLHLDLQRKEDDSSDLQEKLTDYKKQMQQVQKEISAMREEEKLLKQKLADLEKTKKQLQCDLSTRDRTIQQLRLDQSNTKCDETHQLYSKACKDLEAKERVLEEMRLALVEQDETQEKMEKVLEEKLIHIQELCNEVDRLKNALLQQSSESNFQEEANNPSDEVKLAKEKTFQVQESLKILTEKHQTERKKWLEEKLSLIGQAKEAEDKRNQEMRKFVEDRERYSQQQGQLESQLVEKEKTMENWRKERDTLVAALEVQLQKLLSSQAEKDKLIEQLRQQNTQPAQELQGFESSSSMANLQASVTEKEAEILQLRRELEESRATQCKSVQGPSTLMREPKCETTQISGKEDIRASGSSQGSTCFPSVLDSSEISTENGRSSRFPRPELEISFSPLQPNRMALRRQGEESAVTVKITRTARKRKSGEMEKEEVEAENRRNTRSKLTPKLTPQKEEITTEDTHRPSQKQSSSPAGSHESQCSRKEGTLQKIGDFLQSSPTLIGSKAKKMMSLMSGRTDADSAASSSSLALRAKKNRKKLYRPEISSPMEMPSHPILSREPESKESNHRIIKRRLRSKVAK